MSKRNRYKRCPNKEQVKCCFECANCQYIGEGDHICDVSMEIIESQLICSITVGKGVY